MSYSLVDLTAISTLGLASIYLGLLSANQIRQQLRSRRIHEAELGLFQARLENLTTPVVRTGKSKDLAWSGTRKFRIEGKVLEADSIVSFYLSPHDGRPLPPFMPGQYLTFQLDIPGQSKRVTRCYSLSDSPTHPDYYRVSIKRIPPPRDKPEAPPGLGSNFFHNGLQVGDIIDVKAPSGHFFLDVEHDAPVVLIGGGIGITPVLSMLNYIISTESNREVWVFYGARNGTEHVMKDYLNELANEHENVHLHVCYSNPDPEEDVEGKDYQHAERVSVDLFKRQLEANNYDFYICGPPPMMSSLTEDLDAWGVPEKRVHFEAFGPASVKKVSHPEKEAAHSAGIEVTFTRSKKTITWDGSHNSLLEFAEANSIAMDSGCRAGSCGSCTTAIRSGTVDYVKEPDADVDKGNCLTCLAIPKSTLSIDA